MSGQHHALAAVLPGMNPCYVLEKRNISLLLPGFALPVVKPIA